MDLLKVWEMGPLHVAQPEQMGRFLPARHFRGPLARAFEAYLEPSDTLYDAWARLEPTYCEQATRIAAYEMHRLHAGVARVGTAVLAAKCLDLLFEQDWWCVAFAVAACTVFNKSKSRDDMADQLFALIPEATYRYGDRQMGLGAQVPAKTHR